MRQPSPTDEEYAAAVARDHAASRAYREAVVALQPLSEEAGAALKDLIRIQALRRDPGEMLIEEMSVLKTRRPWTLKRLTKLTHRSEDVVQDVLDAMVEAGQLHRVGPGYEVMQR